jgi:S1-C subfamily serine protease
MTAPATSPLVALSDALAEAVAAAARSVVAIHARRRIPSSGIHWSPGVVVTAHHTVRTEDDIRVTLADGATARATLAGRDPGTDIAVLRLDEPHPTVADRAPTAGLAAGRMVLAVGRPGREATAAFGVVSAVGEAWRTWGGGEIDRFVRLDLAIYDGFSGGPLVDVAGRVLGLNTTGLARGLALTIPAATVDRVTEQLLARGHVRRGYLGLAMQPVRLPAALARATGAEQAVGLLVVSVESGSPADQAGIYLGDVILSFAGVPVTDPRDVLAHLGPERVGQPVAVDLVRAGRRETVTVTVGERKREEG